MDKTHVLLCLFAPKRITVYSERGMEWGSKGRNIFTQLNVPTCQDLLKIKKKEMKPNPAI